MDRVADGKDGGDTIEAPRVHWKMGADGARQCTGCNSTGTGEARGGEVRGVSSGFPLVPVSGHTNQSTALVSHQDVCTFEFVVRIGLGFFLGPGLRDLPHSFPFGSVPFDPSDPFLSIEDPEPKGPSQRFVSFFDRSEKEGGFPFDRVRVRLEPDGLRHTFHLRVRSARASRVASR